MNGTLPNWLERWIGVAPAGSGEGTVWNLENTWSWAPWATLLLAIFGGRVGRLFMPREGPAAGRGDDALCWPRCGWGRWRSWCS